LLQGDAIGVGVPATGDWLSLTVLGKPRLLERTSGQDPYSDRLALGLQLGGEAGHDQQRVGVGEAGANIGVEFIPAVDHERLARIRARSGHRAEGLDRSPGHRGP
jgi:hypothetical protein